MSNNYIDCELDSKNNNKMEETAKLKENQMDTTIQVRSKCVRLNEPTPPDLKRIYHKPIYELPILTNEKYRNLDVKERAKLMSDYLTKISNIRASLAARSFLMAPRPRPILPSTKCTNSTLLKADTNETFPMVEESQEIDENQRDTTYVNRFGRQVKRKVYTEETETDAEPETLQNNEQHPYEFGDVKITISNVVREEPKDERIINVYSPIKAKKRLPRAERLFENLLKQDEKEREQEARMAAFEKTLMQADEDLDENHNGTTIVEVSTTASQSNNNRKRRLISHTQDLDSITVMPEESSINEDLKVKKAKDMKKKKNEVECPICNQKYPTNVVEEHASTCGETMQE